MSEHNLDALERRFASSNSVPVERAYLTKVEFDGLIQRLREAEKDKARLDSGMIITEDINYFGDECECHRRGLNLRAMIDAAIDNQRKIATGEDLNL